MNKFSWNKKKCLKCALCASICPKIFYIKNGAIRHRTVTTQLLKNKDVVKKLRILEKSCPGKAIKIL
jgi:ferredoxin